MYVAWCGLSVAFGVLELKIVTQEVLHSRLPVLWGFTSRHVAANM